MKRKIRVCYFLSTYIAISFFSGCASLKSANVLQMYSGPELPRNQIAIVGAYPPATVQSVDGTKIGMYPRRDFFKVLPGPHTYRISYLNYEKYGWSYSESVEEITFDALPGHMYYMRTIRYESDDRGVYSAIYRKIASDSSGFAKKCIESLSINRDWRLMQPKWHVYVHDYVDDNAWSAQFIIDGPYRHIAVTMNNEYEQRSHKILAELQKQEEAARKCILEAGGNQQYMNVDY